MPQYSETEALPCDDHYSPARDVKSVEKMYRARSGGRQADADFAGKFRVRACHESGHFLVAHLNVIRSVTRAVDRANDPVNPVARITVDAFDTPLGYSTDQESLTFSAIGFAPVGTTSLNRSRTARFFGCRPP